MLHFWHILCYTIKTKDIYEKEHNHSRNHCISHPSLSHTHHHLPVSEKIFRHRASSLNPDTELRHPLSARQVTWSFLIFFLSARHTVLVLPCFRLFEPLIKTWSSRLTFLNESDILNLYKIKRLIATLLIIARLASRLIFGLFIFLVIFLHRICLIIGCCWKHLKTLLTQFNFYMKRSVTQEMFQFSLWVESRWNTRSARGCYSKIF